MIDRSCWTKNIIFDCCYNWNKSFYCSIKKKKKQNHPREQLDISDSIRFYLPFDRAYIICKSRNNNSNTSQLLLTRNTKRLPIVITWQFIYVTRAFNRTNTTVHEYIVITTLYISFKRTRLNIREIFKFHFVYHVNNVKISMDHSKLELKIFLY